MIDSHVNGNFDRDKFVFSSIAKAHTPHTYTTFENIIRLIWPLVIINSTKFWDRDKWQCERIDKSFEMSDIDDN